MKSSAVIKAMDEYFSERITITGLAGFTAPGLVSERDSYRYFLREKVMAGYNIKDTSTPQMIVPEWTEQEQVEFIEQILEQFALDYSDFFQMILDDIGITAEEVFSYRNSSLIFELYGFYGIRIYIDEVYSGTQYNDTCISEIKIEL